MNSWYLLNSGKCGAAFNMALDEALLEAMPRLGKPVLRLYGWTERAASFGYFQKFSEVERATLLRLLVRRPTGGGIVPHDADWTYSVVFPPQHEWHLLKAAESYRRIHEWIQNAFTKLNIATELAPFPLSALSLPLSKACFAGHEKSDLLWRGKKIAGAAQRRNRSGLLIQGSVQPPPVSIARAVWEKAMCGAARDSFRVEWVEFAPDGLLAGRAEELSREKYARDGYNQKR